MVSLFFLVIVLLGYLFQVKILLHLGAVGVIAANIGMLAAGIAYLVTLPFKESLRHGLANLLIPFYAIYYWTTRWPKDEDAGLQDARRRSCRSLLVAIAYVVYEEAPVVEEAVEERSRGSRRRSRRRCPPRSETRSIEVLPDRPRRERPPRPPEREARDDHRPAPQVRRGPGCLRPPSPDRRAADAADHGPDPRDRRPAADRRADPAVHPGDRAADRHRRHRRGDGPRPRLLLRRGRPGPVPLQPVQPPREPGDGPPRHPAEDPDDRRAAPAAGDPRDRPGAARPDPDERRHRQRQEHHAGRDRRPAQRAPTTSRSSRSRTRSSTSTPTRSRSSRTSRSAATRRRSSTGSARRCARRPT